MRKLIQRMTVVVPILLGVGAFVLLKSTAPEPETRASLERVRALRVITVEPLDFVPRALGFGVAQPASTWRAVARVEGRLTQLSERLRPGGRIAAGEELVRIEEAPYELSIARLEADIAKTHSELEELRVGTENDRAALAIEEESLELAQAALGRLQALLEEGSVSESVVDEERRAVLAQRQSVRGLESSLALAPAKQKSAEARLAASEAELADAHLELEYTRIVAPFDGLVADVQLDVGQFVARGELLFEFYGTATAEIDAEFLYGEARRTIGPEAAVRIAALIATGQTLDSGLSELFETRVRMRSGDLAAEWPGRLVGSREVVDSTTRALALTVAVDDSFENAIPGERPPLLKGTFCEVELRGAKQLGRIVLPRSAVRADTVAVVDAEGRLERRPVEVAFTQGDVLVLTEGVVAGDRVIVSDLGAAVDGTLIDPIEDEALAADLRELAAANGPLR